MWIRWINAITDFIHKGYNTFLYGTTSADTVGPTVMYGLLGR